MKIFSADQFVLPLPAGHRFPMRKYAELRRRVEASSWARPEQFHVPPAATDAEILRAHDADYLERVCQGTLDRAEVRRIGFPWSPGLVERSRRSAGATIAASRAALEYGVAINLAGGTHHAFRNRGEGFCVFNDSVIAARAMQEEGCAQRVLVVDCDVHQGNGTAAICANDPTIFTFSIHGARNFPFRKEISDLDLPLEDNTEDGPYLDALDRGLDRAFAEAGADLVIYLAGADPWSGDRWGRLALTKDGLSNRDARVFHACRERGLPIVVTMAGGYAPRVEDTVDIHVATVSLAAEVFTGWRGIRSEAGGS